MSFPALKAPKISVSCLPKRQLYILPSAVNRILLQPLQNGSLMVLITANVPL